MAIELTTEQVWKAITEELFAVLGMVTAKSKARTAGVVYREFVTYGIGIPLMQMRFPEKARGRAPVNHRQEVT